MPMMPTVSGHATYVACGLKYQAERSHRQQVRHATYVACGLKFGGAYAVQLARSHATYVACGLKSRWRAAAARAGRVMPRMWHVD